jgi:predicted amidohydrolase
MACYFPQLIGLPPLAGLRRSFSINRRQRKVIPKEYEKYEKVVTISAVNFNPVWGDKEANLKKIKKATAQAAQTGSNIIVFPELALSGYECGDETRSDKKPSAMHVAAAETIPGPSTKEIARTAKNKAYNLILHIFMIFSYIYRR